MNDESVTSDSCDGSFAGFEPSDVQMRTLKVDKGLGMQYQYIEDVEVNIAF